MERKRKLQYIFNQWQGQKELLKKKSIQILKHQLCLSLWVHNGANKIKTPIDHHLGMLMNQPIILKTGK